MCILCRYAVLISAGYSLCFEIEKENIVWNNIMTLNHINSAEIRPRPYNLLLLVWSYSNLPEGDSAHKAPTLIMLDRGAVNI